MGSRHEIRLSPFADKATDRRLVKALAQLDAANALLTEVLRQNGECPGALLAKIVSHFAGDKR